MFRLKNDTPASLRTAYEGSRFAQSLARQAEVPARAVLENRAAASSKASSANLVALPSEPEDARLTGLTRSLNRRLLGLNLRGRSLKPVVLT